MAGLIGFTFWSAQFRIHLLCQLSQPRGVWLTNNWSISVYTCFQLRVCYWIFFLLFLNLNICCGYTKEPSRWDGSFEHPKHMFILMGKKIITILRSENFLIGPMLILSYTHLLRRNIGFSGSSHWIIAFSYCFCKHILWVHKRTISIRWFFWAPKTYVHIDG